MLLALAFTLQFAAAMGADQSASAATSCSISPRSLSLPVASGAQLSLACYDTSASAPCKGISWSSTAGSVSGGDSSATFSSGTVAGSGSVAAKGEGFSCSIPVSILPGSLAQITVLPETASLIVGQSRQFSASARDAYGNTVAIGAPAWSISDKIGTISLTGLFTATGAGTTYVTARHSGVEGTARVSISEPEMTESCVVTPQNPRPVVMTDTTVTVRCYRSSSGGLSQEVQCPTVSWSATSGSLSNPHSHGQLSAVTFTAGEKAGKAMVAASYRAGFSNDKTTCSATLDVQPDEPAKVSVYPAKATLKAGESITFTASVSDKYQNTIHGARVFWSVSGSFGKISDGGAFTAVSEGSGLVRASLSSSWQQTSGISGTSEVEVFGSSPPPPPPPNDNDTNGTGNGGTGGGGGGTGGGGAFASSSTVFFTCAGQKGEAAISVFRKDAAVLAEIYYIDSTPVKKVLSKTATSSSRFDFMPTNAGEYSLRVTVDVDQRSTEFYVPECTPDTIHNVQNATVQLAPAEPTQQPASRPSNAGTGSQESLAQQAPPTLFGIPLPTDTLALAAIGVSVAAVFIAGAYFLFFGRKNE